VAYDDATSKRTAAPASSGSSGTPEGAHASAASAVSAASGAAAAAAGHRTGPRRSVVHLRRDSLTSLHNEPVDAAVAGSGSTSGSGDGAADGSGCAGAAAAADVGRGAAGDDGAAHSLDQLQARREEELRARAEEMHAQQAAGDAAAAVKAAAAAAAALQAGGGGGGNRYRAYRPPPPPAPKPPSTRRLNSFVRPSLAMVAAPRPSTAAAVVPSSSVRRVGSGGGPRDGVGPIIWLAGNIALPRRGQYALTERVVTSPAPAPTASSHRSRTGTTTTTPAAAAAAAASSSSEEDAATVRRLAASAVHPSPAYLASLASLRGLTLKDGPALLSLLGVRLDAAVPDAADDGGSGGSVAVPTKVGGAAAAAAVAAAGRDNGGSSKAVGSAPTVASTTDTAFTADAAQQHQLRYLHLVVTGPAYGLDFGPARASVSPRGHVYQGASHTVVRGVAPGSPFRQLLRLGDQLVAVGGIDTTALPHGDVATVLRYVLAHASEERGGYLLTLLLPRTTATRARLARALEEGHAARCELVARYGDGSSAGE
jgi:hypothetical protein